MSFIETFQNMSVILFEKLNPKKMVIDRVTFKGLEKLQKKVENQRTNLSKNNEIIKELRVQKNSLEEELKELQEVVETVRPEINKDKLTKWSKRVKAIGKCDICSSTDNLTAHHLWDKKNHPSLIYQDENGVCLCTKCHNAFHNTYTQKSHCTPSIYNKFKIKRQTEINMGWIDD